MPKRNREINERQTHFFEDFLYCSLPSKDKLLYCFIIPMYLKIDSNLHIDIEKPRKF